MAQATEAPASITAEGPTSHTLNQPEQPVRRRGELSPAQIGYLLRGIDQMRIGRDGKGFSHVEAWDIRRHLIRVFGFGGHDTDMLEVSMISESSQMKQKMGKNGPYGDPYEAWTVIYRVAVRLAVKVDGVELGHWHGVATGDASNQPSRADAHDLALKTADSQALKRAATNLGDQFGLSLYNKGSVEPVVQGSLAYLKPRSEQKFKDDQVEPEPDVAAAREEAESATAAVERTPEQQEDAHRQEQAGGTTLEGLKKKINAGWSNRLSCEQNLQDARRYGLLDETVKVGEMDVRVEDLLTRRVTQLKEQAAQGGDTGRSAA